MIEERKLAYLEAMDVPVWLSRNRVAAAQTALAQPQSKLETPPQPQAQLPEQETAEKTSVSTSGLKLGPGAGGVMLVCGRDSDSASKLANDISRALRKMPVWAWPDSDEQALTAAGAVEENLFTCVAIFGEALGHLLFGNDIPASLGSANLVVLPAMSELKTSASARRELWSVLCRSGMITS